MPKLFAVLLACSAHLVPLAAQESDVDPARVAQLAALARKIRGEVETLRGLAFKAPIPCGVQTRKALSAFLKTELDRELNAEVAGKLNAMLGTVGLVPAGTDIAQVMHDVLGENVAGFYNPATRKLFLVAEGDVKAPAFSQVLERLLLGFLGKSQEELVMAHELTHALDDQHFDVLGLNLDQLHNDDRLNATKSLLEGVANLVMYDHLLGRFGGAQLLVGRDLLSTAMGATGQPALDKAPAYVKASLLAPYTAGLELVATVKARGGWAAVNKMYADPPSSMEQVLHPAKYLDRDRPVAFAVDAKTIAGVLEPKGYAPIGDETLGELSLRIVLTESGVDATTAIAAAQGWDGDRYHVLRGPAGEPHALVQLLAMDSEDDARELEAAYTAVVARRHPQATRGEAGRWSEGARGHAVVRMGARVHVVESVPAELVAPLLAELAKVATAEVPDGLPKLDAIPREALPAPLAPPTGWTADAAPALELAAASPGGSALRVMRYEGALAPAALAARLSEQAATRVSGHAVLPVALADLPAGALAGAYQGTARADRGERRFLQLVVPGKTGTYVVVLESPPAAWDADREAILPLARGMAAR